MNMRNLLKSFNEAAGEQRETGEQGETREKKRKKTETEPTWKQLGIEKRDEAENEERPVMTEEDREMYYESACMAKMIVCLECGDMKRSCACKKEGGSQREGGEGTMAEEQILGNE